jgi:hypothetical protein
MHFGRLSLRFLSHCRRLGPLRVQSSLPQFPSSSHRCVPTSFEYRVILISCMTGHECTGGVQSARPRCVEVGSGDGVSVDARRARAATPGGALRAVDFAIEPLQSQSSFKYSANIRDLLSLVSTKVPVARVSRRMLSGMPVIINESQTMNQLH